MPIVDFERLFLAADNLRNNARVDQAIAAYKEIISLCTQTDEQVHAARAWHQAGVSAAKNILEDGSYYRDAELYFSNAEKIFQALQYQENIGALQRDRAIAADNAGKRTEAQGWFHKSLETLAVANSPAELGMSQIKFGLHLYNQQDYQAAAEQLKNGLKTLEAAPSAGYYFATGLYHLACVKFKLGENTESLELATASLSWFEADHDQHQFEQRTAQLHGLLFVLYYHQGNSSQARKHGQNYQRLLKKFDPLAVKVIEKELEVIARER